MKQYALIFAPLLALLPACTDSPAEVLPADMSFGSGIGETYSSLTDGSNCIVRFAAQGGFWAMYRVRANVPDGAELDCGLLVGDELVAERPTIMRYSSEDDVAYGNLQLPVLAGEQDRVGTLAGKSGEMYCFYNEQRFAIDVVINVTYPDDDLVAHSYSNPYIAVD